MPTLGWIGRERRSGKSMPDQISFQVFFVLLVILSASPFGVLAQCVAAQSYDYVLQAMEVEAYVVSPREARCRYSFTIRNDQTNSMSSFMPDLDSRVVGPGYMVSIDRIYDVSGSLSYEYSPAQGKTQPLKVFFRKEIAQGESYAFAYEYTVKWDYNSYGWAVGWSTSRIIEKIKLKVSISDPMRIVYTDPAGAFKDDRKSAEAEATNTKSSYLWAYYPPTTGKQSILALLVEFPDVKHKVSREEVSNRIFREMASYFKEISFNQVSVTGDATDWITLPKSSKSYGVSGYDSPRAKRQAFLEEVIRTADDTVNYSLYDCVFVIVAGDETVWAFSTRLGSVIIRTNDGVSVERVTVQSEYRPWGTFAHEFGHQLCLPDLYDHAIAAKLGVDNPQDAAIYVGPYDVMSRSESRSGMLGWSKLTLGWIPSRNVQVVNPGGVRTVKINRLEFLSEGVMLVKIPLSPKQYYLVEVRERIGCDSILPKGGVLVSFVDETKFSGYGPVRLVDANPNIRFFDCAPFDLGPGENSTFITIEKGFVVTILEKGMGWYLAHFTKPESVNLAKEWALTVASRIEQAEKEIEKSEEEGRLEGLNDAIKELEEAKNALAQANYRIAADLALKASTIAQKATQPEIYARARSMIDQAIAQVSETTRRSYASEDARLLVQQAVKELGLANQTFRQAIESLRPDLLVESRDHAAKVIELLKQAEASENRYQSTQLMLITISIAAIVLVAGIVLWKMRPFYHVGVRPL